MQEKKTYLHLLQPVLSHALFQQPYFISLETKTIQVCYAKLINFPIYEIHSKELNNYYALMEVFKFVSIVIRYLIGLHSIFVYTASIKTRTNQTRSMAYISSRPEPTVVSSSHNSVVIIGFRIRLNYRSVFFFLTVRHFSVNEN